MNVEFLQAIANMELTSQLLADQYYSVITKLSVNVIYELNLGDKLIMSNQELTDDDENNFIFDFDLQLDNYDGHKSDVIHVKFEEKTSLLNITLNKFPTNFNRLNDQAWLTVSLLSKLNNSVHELEDKFKYILESEATLKNLLKGYSEDVQTIANILENHTDECLTSGTQIILHTTNKTPCETVIVKDTTEKTVRFTNGKFIHKSRLISELKEGKVTIEQHL